MMVLFAWINGEQGSSLIQFIATGVDADHFGVKIQPKDDSLWSGFVLGHWQRCGVVSGAVGGGRHDGLNVQSCQPCVA